MALVIDLLLLSVYSNLDRFPPYKVTSLIGKTNEEFDADRKARELRKKLTIHDPMELWST